MIELVVHLGAAGTPACPELIVRKALRYSFQNVRCNGRFQHRQTVVDELDVLGVVCPEYGIALCWIGGHVPFDNASYLIPVRLPAVQQSQRFLPLLILEAEMF